MAAATATQTALGEATGMAAGSRVGVAATRVEGVLPVAAEEATVGGAEKEDGGEGRATEVAPVVAMAVEGMVEAMEARGGIRSRS